MEYVIEEQTIILKIEVGMLLVYIKKIFLKIPSYAFFFYL